MRLARPKNSTGYSFREDILTLKAKAIKNEQQIKLAKTSFSTKTSSNLICCLSCKSWRIEEEMHLQQRPAFTTGPHPKMLTVGLISPALFTLLQPAGFHFQPSVQFIRDGVNGVVALRKISNVAQTALFEDVTRPASEKGWPTRRRQWTKTLTTLFFRGVWHGSKAVLQLPSTSAETFDF